MPTARARCVKGLRSRPGQRDHLEGTNTASGRESILESSTETRHPSANLPINLNSCQPPHNKTLPTAPPPLALTAVTSISINIPSSINPATTIVAAGLASPNASRSSANTGSPKSLRSGRM